jgi:hypothetical protein
MNDSNKLKAIGQMNHQVTGPEFKASLFSLYASTNFLKAIFFSPQKSPLVLAPPQRPSSKTKTRLILHILTEQKF